MPKVCGVLYYYIRIKLNKPQTTMKKTIFLLLITMCGMGHLYAQQKFGKVSVADFNSPAEIEDSTADAIYLYKIGESTFRYISDHAVLSTKVRVRMKILTEKQL